MPVGQDSGIVSLTNGCINGIIFNSNNDTPNIPNFSIIIQQICAHFYVVTLRRGRTRTRPREQLLLQNYKA